LVGRFPSIASPGGRRSAVGVAAAPVPLAQDVPPPQRGDEHHRREQQQREYSEEFLGRLDHDGTAGAPIDYRAEEPFRSMDAARRSGRVRVWCLGVGLDPLTLWGEILTVAVFDDEVFDELFSELVVANDEGVVVTVASPGRLAHGVPFVEERVEQLLGAEPMAPAAAACLALAWRDRETLLAN
jgi:hypothetical protein